MSAAALQETSLVVGAALGVAGFGGVFAATGSVVMTSVITAITVHVVGWTCRCSRGLLPA
ncbi:hypothetical protein ACFUVV_04075 [Streptomyces sp. NPDC057376]|uniref:hypothetical protein n=1 Tax=unclassified Streptomyces TaxID=2593676 RepID=UPI001161346A|nr:hypothetical protein [Streptomyces sp. CB02414]